MSGPYSAEFPKVFTRLGIENPPVASCYPYAPVFICELNGAKVVVKRTRSTAEAAQAIAAWTTQLAQAGVRVVAPVQSPGTENPIAIGDDHWVVYPFIDGAVYSGLPEQIESAGELLGRLHSTATTVDAPEFGWPDPPDAESIAEDQDGLNKVLVADDSQSAERLCRLVADFPSQILPAVRDAALPCVNAVMDYKANNLIYDSQGPVLVDPDNGDNAPRVLDLALAALQFHIEHDSAPARMFTPDEWRLFISGYLRHVDLTAEEVRLWPLALEYMLSEFCVWSLVQSDDWDNPRERAFMRDLAAAVPGRFTLPS